MPRAERLVLAHGVCLQMQVHRCGWRFWRALQPRPPAPPGDQAAPVEWSVPVDQLHSVSILEGFRMNQCLFYLGVRRRGDPKGQHLVAFQVPFSPPFFCLP